MTRRVGVVGTGGTISCIGADPYDTVEYADRASVMDVTELIAKLPAPTTGITAVPVPFRAIKSNAMTPEVWLELRRTIRDTLASDTDMAGVVLTHGTASLEETAYFLHLTMDMPQPIVLVGAQRPSTAYGSDAQTNYLAALKTAASDEARGFGTLVVLNDQINSAREVTKTSNMRLETFRTPEFGVLGHADGDGVVSFYRAPTRRHTTNSAFSSLDVLNTATTLPKVDVVLTYVGADGTMIDAAVAAGAKGIVIVGFPPALNTPEQDAAIDRATSQGVVVVQSSRGEGRIAKRTSFPERGIVSGDNLSPQAARLLLSLSLLVTNERDGVQELFDTH